MTPPLLVVVGARPNFVKVAPVWRALEELGIPARLLHTGQHYDRTLSKSFFEQLALPDPDVFLGVGSGTHGEQTAAVLVGVEQVLMEREHAGLLVSGDVNSTLAAALAAAKLGVPVIHLEAGLRSGDWTMPEEINRVLCDRLSDLLLCTSEEALDHLSREGIDPGCAVLVGNTMIDSLFALGDADRVDRVLADMGATSGGYVLATLHRPALVDDPRLLMQTIDALETVGSRLPVLFPVHPRTRARLDHAGWTPTGAVRVLDPVGYLDFVALQTAARLVVTDSGGVQEETSALGVPCLTYRETTERPVTITHGTNRLIGVDPEVLVSACLEELDRPSDARRPRAQIPLWDGAAGPRAAREIASFLYTGAPSPP